MGRILTPTESDFGQTGAVRALAQRGKQQKKDRFVTSAVQD